MEETVLEREEEEILQTLNLNTHENVLKNNAFTIKLLHPNHAIIMIDSARCERVNDTPQIYDGVLFSAATFAATAAVNEEKMFLIGVHIDFLNPVKEEGEILFEAKANVTSSGKKVVDVRGSINGIEFMQGDFMLLKLDEKSLIK